MWINLVQDITFGGMLLKGQTVLLDGIRIRIRQNTNHKRQKEHENVENYVTRSFYKLQFFTTYY
jgi:hypothetical protein